MASIRHIAFHTGDPEKMAKFYCDCFGMTIRQDYPEVPGTARAIFITDGYIEVALIEKKSGATGINHFGFTLEPEEKMDVYAKIRAHGVEPHLANPDRPYVEDYMIDVVGNKVDLSTKGLSVERTHIKEKLGHA
jgi:catechol 2,3-dioxygenase-like lactoylglutathione lyase family enzyme